MVNDNNGLKMKYFSIRKLNRTNLEKKEGIYRLFFVQSLKKKKVNSFLLFSRFFHLSNFCCCK